MKQLPGNVQDFDRIKETKPSQKSQLSVIPGTFENRVRNNVQETRKRGTGGSDKRRKEKTENFIHFDLSVGMLIADGYTSSKVVDTQAFVIYRWIKSTAYQCGYRFFAPSGTPWAKDLADTAGVLSVLRFGYESVWQEDEKLQ